MAFTAADLGTRDTIVTAPARTRVLVPDAALTKRHTPEFVIGQPSTYTIEAGDTLQTIADHMPKRLRLMVLLASWCALRYGEAAAAVCPRTRLRVETPGTRSLLDSGVG